MNKFLLTLILTFSIVFIATTGHGASICSIISSLRSQDPVIVENSCKRLGLVRGALGLSKVQVLHPYFTKSSRFLFIIALSWEGPRDGYLILMDLKGNLLAQQKVGYIKSVSLRPLQIDGDDNLVVDVIRGMGTGVREDQFIILSITNFGFRNLWVGLSYEKSFPGQLSQHNNYELKGFLRFDDLNNDGLQEVIYSAKRIEYTFDSLTKKLIPFKIKERTEVYGLKEGKYLFLREM
jgi:hypothetical protein